MAAGLLGFGWANAHEHSARAQVNNVTRGRAATRFDRITAFTMKRFCFVHLGGTAHAGKGTKKDGEVAPAVS
jgi:hypothetical protein